MGEFVLWSPEGHSSIGWKIPKKCCLTCEHCSDIWWDYTNGPYMIICTIEKANEYHICDSWKSDGEEYLSDFTGWRKKND